MKKAIVTCLFGGYDKLNPAPKFEGWDCYLITDSSPIDSMGWNVIKVKTVLDSKKESRRYKILTHEILPEYILYCYIDANMILVSEPPSYPLWGKHYAQRDLYQEGNEVIRQGKASIEVVNRQLIFYKASRCTGRTPFMQNGFFVRANKPEINYLHECWWEQVEKFSHRDQISLPYVMEALNRHVEGIVENNQIYKYIKITSPHLNQVNHLAVQPSVHHITSGRSDKNIGRAINEVISGLPDTDWVCLRDIDTMPLLTEAFFKQCEAIAMDGKFDLVGCMTNRIGLNRQLHGGSISENPNILDHWNISKERFYKHGSEVKPYSKTIAGLMMLFPKRIWSRVGGFDTGGIADADNNYFDYKFSMKVKKAGGKIGIADGIYLFHFYRFGSLSPTLANYHLY